MATMALDHRFAPASFDPLTAPRVTLKICEWCRVPFVTDKDEARFPGDYISLQRGAGHRAPMVCKRCENSHRIDVAYIQEEARVMTEIAMEIRAERDRFQASSPLRAGGTRERAIQHDPRNQERKRRFAKWREPLMLAFRANEYLTARQIAAVMAAAGGGEYRDTQSAVYAARNAGIPIVKTDKTEANPYATRGCRYCYLYTISSQEEPTPLTPPRDGETHQFMREVTQ